MGEVTVFFMEAMGSELKDYWVGVEDLGGSGGWVAVTEEDFYSARLFSASYFTICY